MCLLENNSSWPPVNSKTAPAPSVPAMILEEDEASIHRSDFGIDMNSGFSAIYEGPNDSSSNLIERDQLNWGTITSQHVITGRTKEEMAFKYLSEKLGEKSMRWVNEVTESGLPYDIIVESKDNSKEYIEVKATLNSRKDWFEITVKEWQFAVEKVNLLAETMKLFLWHANYATRGTFNSLFCHQSSNSRNYEVVSMAC